MRLQSIFSVTLGLTLLVSFAIVSVIFYRHALAQADSEAMREGRLLLAIAGAARAETSEQIAPLIQALPGDSFHPESVPSHVAQTIIGRFNREFPEYTYREKALNPTDMDDRAVSWEVDLIQAFRNDSSLTEQSGVRDVNGRSIMFIAQPIKVTNPSCLSCHGDPEVAPAAMLAAYGPSNGFGWNLGEIVGAKVVTVPRADRLALALSNVYWFLIALGSVLLVVLLVATLMVRRVVVQPARRLAAEADRLSRGESGGDIGPDEQGASEFRILSRAIRRLRRSLDLMMAESGAR